MAKSKGPRLEGKILVYDFNERAVRCGGTIDKPWFVAKDVCDALGIGNPSDALSRLDDDEKGIVSIDTLGGRQSVAVLYESGLFALALTSKKPQAKAFRKWVTSEVLPSIRKTGEYSSRRRLKYQAQGMTQQWIESRETGIAARHKFTDTLKEHGVQQGFEYGIVTNAIYSPLFGGGAEALRARLGIPKGESIRDNLPIKELLAVGLSEIMAQEKIVRDNSHGVAECKTASAIAANGIAGGMRRIE